MFRRKISLNRSTCTALEKLSLAIEVFQGARALPVQIGIDQQKMIDNNRKLVIIESEWQNSDTLGVIAVLARIDVVKIDNGSWVTLGFDFHLNHTRYYRCLMEDRLIDGKCRTVVKISAMIPDNLENPQYQVGYGYRKNERWEEPMCPLPNK